MRILAIDIGTGTQDILVFDTSVIVTNSPKMVMPSPTALLKKRIQQATAARRPLLLTGVIMGGGPARAALARHLSAGINAYATKDAAKTFDDDLEVMKDMGITIVSKDEAKRLRNVEHLETKDLDMPAITSALRSFGVEPRFDAIAVAVLDHGNAPPGVSDRLFRFQHMQRTLQKDNSLSAFVHLAEEAPAYLTRMKAVVKTLGGETPLLLMDTGFAAALGAGEDPVVAARQDRVVVNLGNSHTIAFHLRDGAILGMFEHHTQALTAEKTTSLLRKLPRGTLRNREVFEDGGHGAVVLDSDKGRHFVAAVGPQRGKLADSNLRPYFAVPFGDMMITGCFGLIRACALRLRPWRPEIEQALARASD